jgi:high-affinity Fe2+/Pb2+ permease
MFWAKRNREEHRYYLLPGMGRSNRRKHRQLLYWSVVVGLLVSALFAYLLYCLSGNV